MPYWDEPPYKIVTHIPLSSDITSVLLTNSNVIDRLRNGEDPVRLSIEKWEKIYQVYTIISKFDHPYAHYSDLTVYIGYQTCALCLVSMKKYEMSHGSLKYREDKCSVCPFAKIERCIDDASSFSEIDAIMNHKFEFGDDLRKKNHYSQEYKKLGELINHFILLIKRLK